MALLSNALTTVARFKTFANINNNDQDTLIEILINAITGFTESYCGRTFKQTTYTNEVYDGTGTFKLVLNHAPISSVTLQLRDAADNTDSWTTVDSELYFVKSAPGILETVGWKFIELPQIYRVTYTAGWAFKNDAAPLVTLESLGLGDLEYAIWKLINSAILNRKDNATVQSETIGNYSVVFRKEVGMDAEIKSILGSYTRPEYA